MIEKSYFGFSPSKLNENALFNCSKNLKSAKKLTLSHTLFPSLPSLSLIPLSPFSLPSDTSTLPTTPFLVTVKD